MKRILLLAIAAIGMSSAAIAQVPAGSGTLSGGERLKVSGCGKESGGISVAFTLAANGSWTANVGGSMYAGTSTTAGRVTTLTLSGPSLALLDGSLEDWASDLCDDDVTVSSLTITQAQLKVGKRGDRAKLQVKARGTGTSSEGSGDGKYRLKATGAWQQI